MEKKNLEKHNKYQNKYIPNSFYWGLGIENEFYLQFDNIQFDKNKFLNNHKEERYSLNYFANYKPEIIKDIFPKLSYNNQLPLLVNSHSFTKTDLNNQPKNIYSKNNEPNPNFIGETLWEMILKKNDVIRKLYNHNLVFDGDTFEIITTNFFNTKLDSVIDELTLARNIFIENIQDFFLKNNIFNQFGQIKIMNDNHPFATMLTNINNVSMFNNGTLHFNITLPTQLDENSKIKDWNKFVNIHKNYIKLIQFMEPIFLTIYGIPDPLSDIDNRFSFCSQRCAVSRYIGIGTYDTDLMKTGKILYDDTKNIKVSSEKYGWYKRYYENCAYTKSDKIGYDINFNKHYNHGVEIRFFEHQKDNQKITEIGKYLIYLADFALENIIEDNPINLPDWNDLVLDCMKFGKTTYIKSHIFNKIFKNQFLSTNIINLSIEIFDFLEKKYIHTGQFSTLTLKKNNQYNDINFLLEKNLNFIVNEIKTMNFIYRNELEEQRKTIHNQLEIIKKMIENNNKPIPPQNKSSKCIIM